MDKPDPRGVIIARSRDAAQNGLNEMCGSLGFPILNANRAYVVVTPHSTNAGRGMILPNRVLVFDLEPEEIPDDLWHVIIPAIRRKGHEHFNVFYWNRARQVPPQTNGHRFTVRRQDGIGPHPPELSCAYRQPNGKVCGKRADQHETVPLASMALGSIR